MRMLDEGEFINASGKKISLKNVVIFWTTNLSEYVGPKVIRPLLCEDNMLKIPVEEKLSGNDGLRKEIIGRFDEVIEYNKLTKENCMVIAEKFINKKKDTFEKNNREIGLTLEYDNSLVEKVVAEANTDLLGARDIRKSMQHNFVDPVIHYMFSKPNISNEKIVVTAEGVANSKIDNVVTFGKQ